MNGYLYRHIRVDTNEVFYIGIGGFHKTEPEFSYRRAYQKISRSPFWKNIVHKTNYEVEIVLENLTHEESCEKEREFIKLYGRKDLGTGSLVNMTDGGEGVVGRILSDETRKKLSEANKGRNPSDETRKKLSEAKKIDWTKRRLDKINNQCISNSDSQESTKS